MVQITKACEFSNKVTRVLFAYSYHLVICTASFIPFVSHSQNFADVKIRIEELKLDPDLAHASWGLCIIDAAKDSVVAQYNSEMGLTPASSMKTITTGAGLALLGEDFKWKTEVYYDGTIDSAGGILHGNIYIKGGGDPSIGSKYFPRSNPDSLFYFITKKIESLHVKKINGRVIGDASVFENEMIPVTWIWSDMGNYFGAGASGLTVHDNLYTIYYRSSANGDTVRAEKMVPDVPHLKIKHYVTAGGTSDNAYIYGAPYSNERYVTGTIPANKTHFGVDGSIPDPPYYFAWKLDSALEKNGITTKSSPATIRQLKLDGKKGTYNGKKIAEWQGESLKDVVAMTNRYSVNLFAEHILKTIAWKKNGFGSEDAGTQVLTDFWKLKGVDTKGMYLNDGCGLSKWNSITPRQLAEILRLVSKENFFKTSFYPSLPYISPTMSAKSGSFTRVRSCAGYFTQKDKLYSFAVIFNNFDCAPQDMKDKLDTLLDAMQKSQ